MDRSQSYFTGDTPYGRRSRRLRRKLEMHAKKENQLVLASYLFFFEYILASYLITQNTMGVLDSKVYFKYFSK
jgi:hypothetical protein